MTATAVCAPTADGHLHHGGSGLSGTFRGPGATISSEPGLILALPMLCLLRAEGWWLASTDPTFTTTISTHPTGLSFSWRLLAAAGPHPDEQRLIVLQRVADPQAGLDAWCAQAAPPAARPVWLNDIALNYYDYLGDNGEAWFTDIVAMAKAIPKDQRHHAVVCLHGWYDEIGTYCMQPDGSLKDTWTAFPHLAAMGLRDPGWPAGSGGPREDAYQFRIDGRLTPVAMSWNEVRRRLAFAKDLGFRTAFYAFTGLQRAGSQTAHVADGTGLERPGYIWQGPDLVGETYVANPLHPQVRRFFLDLTTQLCKQVGDVADAMVMDEAYYVGRSQLGPAACPGYAARAQATLIAEMTAICHRTRPELAFLTADLLGHPQIESAVFPYSLWADWHLSGFGVPSDHLGCGALPDLGCHRVELQLGAADQHRMDAPCRRQRRTGRALQRLLRRRRRLRRDDADGAGPRSSSCSTPGSRHWDGGNRCRPRRSRSSPWHPGSSVTLTGEPADADPTSELRGLSLTATRWKSPHADEGGRTHS